MQQYLNRHITTATGLIQAYTGKEPFHLYLKKYFTLHKKHGSKDRKMITALCYGWLRLGKNLWDFEMEERMKIGLFLTTSQLKLPENYFESKWLDCYPLSAEEKFSFLQTLYPQLDPELLFPFKTTCSPAIPKTDWCFSFLHQPDVFIRIRPGHRSEITGLLNTQKIDFKIIEPDLLAFASTARLADILPLDAKVVVQDISSQRTASLLHLINNDRGATDHPLRVWDCCAASGGKSILATDTLGAIDLTVSDIRPSILKSLRHRLHIAAVKVRQVLQLDLTSATELPFKSGFDLIICDAPCSGSGTWARSPENLIYFDESKVPDFHTLQYQIIKKALSRLVPGGYLLYMTCSVFETENEAVVDRLLADTSLILVSKKHFTGYPQKGDSMFGALFSLPK